tara:strand:+ start:19908 stop:23663 length:3756 start_codon:yes stop_codon:yes gene_type:complete
MPPRKKKADTSKDIMPFQFSLTGKLITSVDPTRLILEDDGGTIKDNFKSLKNIRYTDNGIRGIRGMSKINSTALSTQLKARNIHHFAKSQPVESHVLVQAFDTNIDNSKVWRNSTSIPNTGDFNGTALHTDARTTGSITAFAASGTRVQVTSAAHGRQNGDSITITGTTSYNGTFTTQDVATNTFIINDTFVADDATGTWATRTKGRFTNGQLGRLLYCNGDETMVWGGDQARLSKFIVYDPNGTFLYDYTEKVQNTLSDSENVATLKQVSGIGAETQILLHWEEAAPTFLDSSPGSDHDATAVGTAERSVAQVKFGTYSVLLDGNSDWATVADHADMVLSGGTWTFETWVYPSSLAADVGLYAQAVSSRTGDYMWAYIDTNGAVSLRVQEGTTAATGTVTLTGGGSGSVDGITVNSVEIMSGAENYDTDLDTTAVNVAANITANTSAPNYTASAASSVITITSVYKGDHVNTWDVTSSSTTITTSDVNMASGANTTVVTLDTPNSVVTTGSWQHIRVVENSNDYYIFVDGIQKAHVSDASRTEGNTAYDSTVFIGAVHDGTSTTKPFNGHLDETRLTNTALSTTDFDVPASAYTAATANVNIRIGNILPVEGFDFTVSNANTSSGTMSVFYWSSTNVWTAVTNLTDNTASGGIPLAQSGTVTFDSTETTARQKIIDGVLGYWYKIEITDADVATGISTVTVKEPFQDLRDFWDGNTRVAASVQLFEDSIFKDNTVNVFEDSFVFETTTGGDESSYMIMDSLATSTEYLTVGFNQRMQGLECKLIPNHSNTTANTVIEVEYWNGTAWTSVGAIVDGTIENSISFTKSGFITWNPVAENTEFRREVNKEEPLYYYKLSWSQNFTADVLCYFIAGIPVQVQIEKYSFPLNAQSRTWLMSNQSDKKNAAIVSAFGTLNAFNGDDSAVFEFGDQTPITAAAEVFVKLTTVGGVSDLIIAKNNSLFLVTGSDRTDWKITQISDDVGCPAPYTFKASPIGLEFSSLQSKQVVIWQSENGIMMYDSSAVFPVSDSISNFFDQSKSEAINLDKIADSYGFWDNSSGVYEYHWLFASGTSTVIDRELVFDLRRQRWYEIDRESANDLQCGVKVVDTNGAHHNYGMIDSGFMERLENGTAWTGDGSSIAYEFELGDIMFNDDMNWETLLRFIRLTMVQKTSGTITLTYAGDTSSTTKTLTMSQTKSGFDVTMPVHSAGGSKWGASVFHRLKFTVSTNDQTIGFEPLWVSGFYENYRLRLRD